MLKKAAAGEEGARHQFREKCIGARFPLERARRGASVQVLLAQTACMPT